MNIAGHVSASDRARVQIGNVTNQFTFHATSFTSRHPANINRYFDALHISDPADEKAYIEQMKGGLIKDSYKWILDHPDFSNWQNGESSRLLYIKGDAGKGKTMLLCGIIDTLCLTRVKNPHLPIVLFTFCEAARGNFNQAALVLRGLIYRLLCQRPQLASYMQQRYERSSGQFLEQTNTFHILSQVLIDMLCDIQEPTEYIIIIDALDECETGLERLVDFIANKLSQLKNVKCLVSSRRNLIVEQFQFSASCITLEDNCLYTTRAIKAFIKNKTEHLVPFQDNPILGAQAREILEKNAAGTFLWVALVIQELRGVQGVDILETLKSIPAKLTPYYQRMLQRLQGHSPKDFKRCQTLIATMIVAKRSLSLQEVTILADLPGYNTSDPKPITRIVELCESFLIIQDGSVSIIHQSAKNFLLDKALAVIFPLGLIEVHGALFQRSIAIMSNNLHENIAELTSPATTVHNVEILNNTILASTSYSCVYWVDHLLEGPWCEKSIMLNSTCTRMLDEFLSHNLLFWIEALALLSRIPECVSAIKKLQLAIPETACSTLSALIYDAKRFIGAHRLVFETTPLQLYSSALLFSPRHICQIFHKSAPSWITLHQPLELQWDSCLENITEDAQCFSSSPTQSFLAVGKCGRDSTFIELTSSISGAHQKIFESRNVSRTILKFSANEKLLAAGFADGMIEIWDLSSSNCIQSLRGHARSIISLSFSPSCKRLNSTCLGGQIIVWDIVLGSAIWEARATRQPEPFTNDDNWAISTFYAADDIILLFSKFGLLQLFDLSSSKPLRSVPLPALLETGAVSPDGQIITLACQDANDGNVFIEVVNIDTGKSLFSYPFSSKVTSIAYSTDSRQIILITSDGCIQKLGRPFSSSFGSWKVSYHNRNSYTPVGVLAAALVALFEALLFQYRQHQGGYELENYPTTKAFGFITLPVNADLIKRIFFYAFIAHCARSVQNDIKSPFSSIYTSDRGIHMCEVSQQGILTVNNYGQLKLWDTEADSKAISSVHWLPISAVSFSPDGRYAASCSEDGTIKIWDGKSGSYIQSLKARKGLRSYILFSSDNSRLITSSSSDDYLTIQIWHLQSTRDASNIVMETESLAPFAISTDRKWLCIGLRYSFQVFAFYEEPTVLCFTGELDDEPISVTFSYNCEFLAIQSKNGDIVIWNTVSWTRHAEFCSQPAETNSQSRLFAASLAFSSNDKYLVSTTFNETVRIFHIPTGTRSDTILPDLYSLGSIRWHPSSNAILLTRRGLLNLETINDSDGTCLTLPGKIEYQAYGVDKEGYWITKDGAQELRLPQDFAGGVFAIHDSTIIIGSRSGRLLIATLQST